MKVTKIIDILKAEVLMNYPDENLEVEYGCASDLMSDVLAFANSDSMLITGLSNPQVIRTAEMMDISTVVFVRGKKPGKEILELAEENSLTILATDYSMFETCGLLFLNGLKGIDVNE
ncbi:MAG TPA: hypothetical protein GX396_00315 [Tissierellia bacterium]|jgi:predicted transcriptional regulator|nr:hypothetical protein [Tissierellia bacterium]